MSSLCGAECVRCVRKYVCPGCEETDGKPFGGTCLAAEYIKAGGKEKYEEFKQSLLEEINALLKANDIPQADALYELSGAFVNLSYPLPGGRTAKFLDDKNVYLGAQLEFDEQGVCYGIVADMGFILVCRYGYDGADPELLIYKKR